MEKKDKSSFWRFFGSRWFLLTALAAVVLVAVGYARAYYQDYQVRQEIENLKEQVQKLEKKKLESMEILKYVTSDSFVEEKARTELNLKKPGENVLVVKSTLEENFVQRGEPVEKDHLSNPMKWWYYFIHKTISN